MYCVLDECPFCERKINHHVRSDGSCPCCNRDLSHISFTHEELKRFRKTEEEAKKEG